MSTILMTIDRYQDVERFCYIIFRNSVGVLPVAFLKAVLKEDSYRLLQTLLDIEPHLKV